MGIKHFENKNATNTEKVLYQQCGYYLIEARNSPGDMSSYRYVVCYTSDNLRYAELPDGTKQYIFPEEIDIDEESINYDDSICFDGFTETVKVSSYMDSEFLELLMQRLKEIKSDRGDPETMELFVGR